MPIQFRSTKRGSPFPLPQSIAYDYDPQHGWVIRQHFRGIDSVRMQALQNDYVRGGVACRLIIEGDLATLETEDSTRQFTIDNWQLLGNSERMDIFSHPFLEALIIAGGGSTDAVIAKMREELEANTSTAAAFASGVLLPFAGTEVQDFYTLKLRGTEEFENDAFGGGYVLRHTTNAPNRWDVNVADFGVGEIYTPAQLLSEVQSTFYWIVPLPDRLAYKISNIPEPEVRVGYLWGWKKSRSTEVLSANNRIDIVTEYVLEQWATALYDPY